MKIKIVKCKRTGDLTIEFSDNPNKPPMSFKVPRQQVPGLIAILNAANNADVFSFEIDL